MSSLNPTRTLPANPSLEQHKKQAKELLKAHRSNDSTIGDRLRASLSRLSAMSDEEILTAPFTLGDAQFVIAREHGFESWPRFQRHVKARALEFREKTEEFLRAATPNLDRDHRAGTVQAAGELLKTLPELRAADIYAAAILGDADLVERLLEQEPALAVKPGGPHNWEPLLYVCFSRFLRQQPGRGEDFVRTARLLLANGADPNAFFMANREHESALYGAAGVARNAALTRVLLESGAEPNDDEAVYHASEVDDLSCLREIVAHGYDLNRSGTALLRRLDWDDIEGVRWLLEAGAHPDGSLGFWGKTGLHQAVLRGRSAEFFSLLLQYGADPNARSRDGRTPYELAMRRGRLDAARSLLDAGASPDLNSVDRFLAACSRADAGEARSIVVAEPGLVASLTKDDLQTIVDMASAGAIGAVRVMLDNEFPIGGPGDGAPTPLHQAAWYGQVEMVAFLLDRGASVHATEQWYGGTALGWAIHASAGDSTFNGRHAAIVEQLIKAGSKVPETAFGSEEVAAVLRRYGAA